MQIFTKKSESSTVINLLERHCHGNAPGGQDSKIQLSQPDSNLKEAAVKVIEYMKKHTKRGMFGQYFSNFTKTMFGQLLHYCRMRQLKQGDILYKSDGTQTNTDFYFLLTGAITLTMINEGV